MTGVVGKAVGQYDGKRAVCCGAGGTDACGMGMIVRWEARGERGGGKGSHNSTARIGEERGG